MTKRLEKAIQIISKLNQDELRSLSKALNERFSYLESLQVMKFHLGEKVTFKDCYNRKVEGIVKKLNRKSVKVLATDGRNWQVAPCFLKKVKV